MKKLLVKHIYFHDSRTRDEAVQLLIDATLSITTDKIIWFNARFGLYKTNMSETELPFIKEMIKKYSSKLQEDDSSLITL